MNSILAPMALAISSMLFTSIWEGAIIVAIVWTGLRCVPKLGASTRHAIWLCTLMALVAAPIATTVAASTVPSSSNTPVVLIPVTSSSETSAHRMVAARNAQHSAAAAKVVVPSRRYIDVPLVFSMVVALLCLALAAARSAILVAHLSELARLRRTAVRVRDAFGYPVLASARATVPLAVGFFRPAVMLPANLGAELSPKAIEAIVMHEAAHLRRYDVWTNLVVRILEIALVLNPIAWFVSGRLCVEREIACDDWVVSRIDGGEVLARALATLSCRPLVPSLAVPAAVGSKNALVERIERLLDRRPRRLRVSAGALAGALALLLAFTAIVPVFSPVLALAEGPSLASTTACVNHGIMIALPDFRTGKPSHRWVPLGAYAKRATNPRDTVVDATVDANGKLTNVTIVSSPYERDAAAAKNLFERSAYRPAVIGCHPTASSIRVAFGMNMGAAVPISVVSAVYPHGWSRQHPGACKVPDLLHGGIPDVKLTQNTTLSGSVRVVVDARGNVIRASLLHRTGDRAFDAAMLAAAKSYVYPLGASNRFKPVRPDGAPLAWNATHGYNSYATCAPLPTQYTWTTTFPSAGK